MAEPLTLIDEGAYTTSQTSGTKDSHGHAAMWIFIKVTAASGTGGLQLQIRAHDPLGLASKIISQVPLSITTVDTFLFYIGPGAGDEFVGLSAPPISLYLPPVFSVQVGHGDGSSYTYGVRGYLAP